jgi:serine/threonine protein kinase
MQSSRWTTVQESEFPWEREALAHLRGLLPDAEPFRAWSNFEFIGEDGSINEVDLLVVGLHRIYLVEIKSAPGVVEGDAGTWTWTQGGQARSMDNPLLLANRKAKKLKSLLARQPALKRQRVPYVEAVVFLSHKDVRCALEGSARMGVYLRESADRDGDAHVGELLTGARELESGQVAPGSRIDPMLSRAVAKGLEQAGIRPTQRHRQVGDFVLQSLINETDVFQDWEAQHVRFPKSRRRIRIYPNALQSSETTRAERHRAAEREYRLLDGVVHGGILRVESFTEHERGPALVFEHPEPAERLDFFLQRRLAGLSLKQRLTLVRQIAETLQYAQTRRLYHQALTPQSILVTDPESSAPGVKIFNWQAGHSELGSESATRLTVHQIVKVGLAGEAQGVVYLAPELYSVGALDRARLDVFSLGALAYHVLSGAAPAATVEELHEKLLRGGGLLLSEVFDGARDDLEDLVQMATAPETSDRADIDYFLELLDRELALLDAPEPGRYVNPLDAGRGDELEGGFVVQRRLGRGSTAVALLVARGDEEGVLKVALEPRLNERILQEGEVLRGLHHHSIVRLLDVVEVSGHATLFLEAAGTRSGDDRPGTYTLAQRIREEGRLSLDLLQRFGEELLGVVDHLEHAGISHRDLKPDNIGIGQTPRGTLRLVLFDFSLSGTPSENTRAGTPPYLDPFLSLRKPPRWDPYAERFAAAMTLYEMATGQLPGWGDGHSHPALVDAEVTLDVGLFDPAVREGLARFFGKALKRDYQRRFDTAEEMRRAWARVFEQIDEPSTVTTDPGAVDLDAALAGASADTPLVALPLSPRVLNALERMGVNTLRELQELPRIRLYRNKGIGQRTVKDVRELAEKVAEHLAGRPVSREPALAEQDPGVEPRFWSIDTVMRRLLPRQGDADEPAILRGLLGLAPLAGRTVAWPAQQDVAEGLSYPREDVRRALEGARERWSKDRGGWMVPLRDDVAGLVEKHGGVLTRGELVTALLRARGSAAADGEREAHAAAVAYAAIEVEASREGARYILYRGSGDRVFLLATAALGEAFGGTPAARARYAEELGKKADELAGADPLLLPERALEALAEVAPPEGERALPADRLLRLAVSASAGAALSSRMELYPRGMPAARALRLGAGSLLGPKKLTPDMVQARIASRYPAAAPLPGRPALDGMLEEAGLHLRWDAAEQKYAAGRPGEVETSSVFSRHTTAPHPDEDAAGVDEAWAVERRLESVAPQRRLLVLTVEPRYHALAERELRGRFGLQRVSLDGLLLREMRAAAAEFGARWELVLRADAADRDSRDWRNLRRVVDRALERVQAELAALTAPALLVYPGLLARYGRLDVFDALRAACEAGRAPGFVLLIAADRQRAMPVIDEVPLPVVHASEWARIPDAWLHNRHRGGPRVLAAAG